MGTSIRPPRCVLCQTCANRVPPASRERRKSKRMCSAGMNPTADLYDCDSYVSALVLAVPLKAPQSLRA